MNEKEGGGEIKGKKGDLLLTPGEQDGQGAACTLRVPPTSSPPGHQGQIQGQFWHFFIMNDKSLPKSNNGGNEEKMCGKDSKLRAVISAAKLDKAKILTVDFLAMMARKKLEHPRRQ